MYVLQGVQQKPAMPGMQQAGQQQPGQQQGQQQQGHGQVMNKNNRITPLTKPAGLDPVILLTERENRYVIKNVDIFVVYLVVLVTYAKKTNNYVICSDVRAVKKHIVRI